MSVLGVKHVEVGKTYRVVNGDWTFKVLKIDKANNEVLIKHRYGEGQIGIKESADENKSPLWIEEEIL